jgi:hypothetical protein
MKLFHLKKLDFNKEELNNKKEYFLKNIENNINNLNKMKNDIELFINKFKNI